MRPRCSSAVLRKPLSRMIPSSAYTRSRNEVQNGSMIMSSSNPCAHCGLRAARDGVGHGVAERQADQGREKSGAQRVQVGDAVHLVGEQVAVVAESEGELQVVVAREGDDVGERRHARGALGEADFEGEGERNEKEYEQEQQGRQNDEPAAGRPGCFHGARFRLCQRSIVRDKLGSGTAMSQPASTALAEPAANGGGSRIRQRQRQRLIDACISALHLYGPSRTTVEKVVALADLSPGIVRFYFESKAAMLIASLAYLAAEFEERVLLPVARMKDSPVQALRLLVELYLSADIASPRKVSVWDAFWGEATARQEYQDICGKKDDEFAVLVRELVERLIAATGATHLDADAVALGLRRGPRRVGPGPATYRG